MNRSLSGKGDRKLRAFYSEESNKVILNWGGAQGNSGYYHAPDKRQHSEVVAPDCMSLVAKPRVEILTFPIWAEVEKRGGALIKCLISFI